MVLQNNIKTIFVILIFVGFTIGAQSTSAVEVWTAHVKWVGYDFLNDSDCGDGYLQRCENRMQVYRTSSSSCTGKSWAYGAYENNYPYGISGGNGYYEITWSRAYGAPCLTFSVKFYENSAGSATNTAFLTINSNGDPKTSFLGLNLGSANGDFEISYWLTATD